MRLLLPLLAIALLGGCAAGDDAAAPETTSTTTSTTSASTTPTTGDAPAADDPAEATRALFAAVAADDPGCTVAVGRDGEVVFAEAYGAASLDPTVPMSTATVVDIGSTSKQFTATAVLLLDQRGLVDLDASLATYLPALPGWSAEPTLRQLLHHESGIPDYIGLLVSRGFALTGRSTDADALAALGEVDALDFAPGTAWAYSNSNYFLLAEVVEAVTGASLATFLDTEVFGALGLDMVMDPAAALPGKATSYEGTGAARRVADSRWEQLGDGGIQTTPSELVRWATEYWAPTIGGADLLAARLDGAVAMAVPGGPGDLGRYGAGIQAREVDGLGEVLSHAGGWGGFVTVFTVLPQERLAVAATCTSPDTAQSLGITDETDVLRLWAG